MRRIQRYSIVLLTACIATTLLSDTAYGWWWRRRKAHQKKTRAEKKKYQYIKSHDFNGDGIVDAKDRLLWLKKKEGQYTSVYIAKENEDLAEMMDVDGNGDVQPWEMQQFIKKYDSNKNGILENNEIDAAAE
jgi:hypothetical protein